MQADRRPPMPGWYRPPMPPAKSPHSLCRSSWWCPPGGSSSRLSRPGCAGRFSSGRMLCGTSRPMHRFFLRADGQHIWTWGCGSLVMDGEVGAHPLVHKVVLHIGPDKGKLLLPGQYTFQAASISRASWLSLAFSICSTLFQRVERSANSGGA